MTRLETIQKLVPRYNYNVYSEVCSANKWDAKPIGSWSQLMGMLSAAEEMYPDDLIDDAYAKFIALVNKDTEDRVAADAVRIKEAANRPPISMGVGDTIAKITHATGLDKLSQIYTQITGKPCGCQNRQEALNKLFPYGVKE